MRENFLHYLWKYQKFKQLQLVSNNKDKLQILNVGQHNTNAGPDFLHARVRINDQIWVGNVELHVKASDWDTHGHGSDPAYGNVILHVVWEYDRSVNRYDGTKIPTLVLKHYVPGSAIDNYRKLFKSKNKWINCESEIAEIDNFVVSNWMERLYFERLENKCWQVDVLLEQTRNDWEAVLFQMLARNFGFTVNADAFASMARHVPFNLIRKLQWHPAKLEALWFGLFGLLEQEHADDYYNELKEEFFYLKQKFRLSATGILPLQFFRIRPSGFPTIRLSQLARLYASRPNLFSDIIEADTMPDFYKLFRVKASDYWTNHYRFGKAVRPRAKIISKEFIDKLVINTIVPLKFKYARHMHRTANAEILKLVRAVKAEKNNIYNRFTALRPFSNSALYSQALIELKTNYCAKNNCLHCAIGNQLLNRN